MKKLQCRDGGFGFGLRREQPEVRRMNDMIPEHRFAII